MDFLAVIVKQRIWSMREKVYDAATSESKIIDSETSLTNKYLKNLVFHDWSSSIFTLERQEQLVLMDYCRYDLVKAKECLISLKDEHSFIEMQNRDLQLRVDELLQEISTTLENNKQT